MEDINPERIVRLIVFGFMFVLVAMIVYPQLSYINCVGNSDNTTTVEEIKSIDSGGLFSPAEYVYKTGHGEVITRQKANEGEKIVLGCD